MLLKGTGQEVYIGIDGSRVLKRMGRMFGCGKQQGFEVSFLGIQSRMETVVHQCGDPPLHVLDNSDQGGKGLFF